MAILTANLAIIAPKETLDLLIAKSLEGNEVDLSRLMECPEYYTKPILEEGLELDTWDIGNGEDGEGPIASLSLTYEIDAMGWQENLEGFFEISEAYPDSLIVIEYGVESDQFVTFCHINNGTLIHVQEVDWDSEEGIEIRESLGYDVGS